ncbi:MAG: phosphatase PAP2 family protein [Saprospiraceae bacterium]
MFEMLQHWDAAIFQFINSSLGNPFFDALLPWCREKLFWVPVYAFVAAFAILNFRVRGLIILAGLVLAVGLADFSSSTLVKKNVQRLRPCNDPVMFEKIQLRVPCGGGYSFTSSHAANHFAAAVYLISIFGGLAPWLRSTALLWAGLIAFSQVYVGVHYPGDVLFGAFLGAAIGWWTSVTWRRWFLPGQFYLDAKR